MIDDEFDRLQRIDRLRIAAHRGHRVAHRGKIDDAWNAGKILQQDARGPEGDLFLVPPRRAPTRERFDVGLRHGAAVFKPQQILEQES